MLHTYWLAAILIILATPILSLAQSPYQAAEGLKNVFPNDAGLPVSTQNSPVSGTQNAGFSIQNPLKYGTISALLKGISGYLISLGAGVATLMVLWGAFQILTAKGDARGYEAGKQTIMYAAIGLGILLLAGGIGSLVSDILGGGTGETLPPVLGNPYGASR